MLFQLRYSEGKFSTDNVSRTRSVAWFSRALRGIQLGRCASREMGDYVDRKIVTGERRRTSVLHMSSTRENGTSMNCGAESGVGNRDGLSDQLDIESKPAGQRQRPAVNGITK
jgi:hypothetical protein